MFINFYSVLTVQIYPVCWNAFCYFQAIGYMFAIATQSLVLLTKSSQGGESSIAWWRNVFKRPGGETSRGRTDEGAKRPVTTFLSSLLLLCTVSVYF